MANMFLETCGLVSFAKLLSVLAAFLLMRTANASNLRPHTKKLRPERNIHRGHDLLVVETPEGGSNQSNTVEQQDVFRSNKQKAVSTNLSVTELNSLEALMSEISRTTTQNSSISTDLNLTLTSSESSNTLSLNASLDVTSIPSSVPTTAPSTSDSPSISSVPSVSITPTSSNAPSPAPGIIFQAEDYTSQREISIRHGFEGFTGTGYADFGDAHSYIEWAHVDAIWPGEYVIAIRYAVDDPGDNRACKIIVNGAHVGDMNFVDTGSKSNWRKENVVVVLNEGRNKVRVVSYELGPNIDYMELSPLRVGSVSPSSSPSASHRPSVSSAPSSSIHVFQAEAYTDERDCDIRTTYGGYTGSGYADFGGSKSYIEWSSVQAAWPGDYEVRVRYAVDDSDGRECKVIVNGADVGELSFDDTGSRSVWKEESVVVALAQGENTVRIQSIGSGPNIDKMQIRLIHHFSDSPSLSPSSSSRPTSSARPSSLPSLAPSTPSPTAMQTERATRRSFQLRMYWEREYMWQEESSPRSWCVECIDKCQHDQNLEIQECRDDDDKQRWYYHGGRIFSAYNPELCISEELGNDRIKLLRCGHEPDEVNQMWRGFQRHGKFELHPRTSISRCFTQQHHPKKSEEMKLQECKEARGDKTSKWVVGYWDDHKSKGRAYRSPDVVHIEERGGENVTETTVDDAE